MSRTNLRALGLALALGTSLGFGHMAAAQVRDTGDTCTTKTVDGQPRQYCNGHLMPVASSAPAASEPDFSGVSSASTGSPSGNKKGLLVTHSDMTGGWRAAREGDNDVGIVSIEKYNEMRSQFPGMASADETASLNTGACTRTGSWIRRSLVIKSRIAAIRGTVDQLDVRLVRLGQEENHVSWLRRGVEVASVGAYCAIPLVGWAYCLGVGLATAAGEANNTVHDSQNKVDLDQRKLTNTVMGIDLDTRDLDIDERIGWAEMVHGYCLDNYPDQTTGAGSPSAGS